MEVNFEIIKNIKLLTIRFLSLYSSLQNHLTLKRLIHFLKENLDISMKEAKSTLAFVSVALFSMIIYLTVNRYTTGRQTEVIIETYSNEKPPEKVEETAFEKVYENEKNKNYERFKFNPNLATKEEFSKLGIPEYVSKTILKYRAKGGKFKFKNDFQKIYSLKPELYAELYAWIDLPEKTITPDREEFRAETSKEPTHTLSETPKAYKPKTIQSFDINTADTAQLKELKGIGSVYASRIVKFRDGLGGFHSISQIDETYGLSPEALIELKKYGIVKTVHRKISINEVESFKHPYLKFNQVKAIISYRKQHGKFNSAEDLKNVKILDEETIRKISPYLSF